MLLLTAFVLYARDRWPAVFDDPRSVSPATGEATRTPVTEQVLSWAFVIGSAALAALCTCNAVVGNGLHPDPAPFQRIGDIVFAVLAAAGATAFLRMQNGGPMRHGLLIAGWIGSSATFAESLILITGLLLAGEGDSRAYGPAGSLVVLLALLCGLAGAAVGMIRLESQVSRAAVTDEESELATP